MGVLPDPGWGQGLRDLVPQKGGPSQVQQVHGAPRQAPGRAVHDSA